MNGTKPCAVSPRMSWKHFFEEPTIQLAAKYQYTVKEMKELLQTAI